MKAQIVRVMGVVGVMAGGIASSHAQGADWDLICIDPANTQPYSNPLVVNTIANELMLTSMGIAGTVGYGDVDNMPEGPCFADLQTMNVAGRFAFSIGSLGSVQRSSDNFNDNGMALTFGAPTSPIGSYCYATLTKNGARTLFGANAMGEAFVGFSNRYMSATTVNDNVRIKCQVEVVADVARLRWTLTNLDAEPANIGLWWGATLAMLTSGGASSNAESGGAQVSHYFGQKPGYVWVPTGRPPRTDVVYDRVLRPADFPPYIDFVFGQTDYFGMRIENIPSEGLLDPNPANAPTEANKVIIGKHDFIMGAPAAATPTFNPDALLPDTLFTDSTSFIQQFPEQQVAAGASRQILFYVRSTWGVGNYSLPYGAVVDAPKLIATRTTDFDGNPATGGIVPNPFRIRVYVDNVGGFAFDGREFPLENVKVNLEFGPNSNMTISNGSERSITRVEPQDIRFVDYTVTANADAAGIVPYTVTITTGTTGATNKRVMSGTINIAARPRLTLKDDVNFVTTPFVYADSSWQAILEQFLDPNVAGGEVQVFAFDPEQEGYINALGAERGKAFWIVYKKGASGSVTADLGGQPTQPSNFLTGAPTLKLQSGWNQLGNPYNYGFPISQILGVSASNPSQSFTWADLVSLGYVSNFLAEYDPATGDYAYVDGSLGRMEPGKGYWVFVSDPSEITLSYPPLFDAWVPGQSRTASKGGNAPTAKAWTQNANQWRLKLAARNESNLDAENYIGVAASTRDIAALRVFEPPMAPMNEVGLSIRETVNGKQTRLAQSLQAKGGRKEFAVSVTARKPGQVTITWPNLATVPTNLRFHITDLATGTTRDLRRASGYTFTADKAGTREFKVTVEEGAVSRAVIGNVVVSQTGRAAGDRNAPVTISYTLSSAAATSVRILASNGKEVYVASRGRADQAGENTITWTLRDKANRAVAPGTYRAEIVAETTSGERVRKVIAVNVIR